MAFNEMQIALWETFKREFKLYSRNQGVCLQPLLIFILCVGVFTTLLKDLPYGMPYGMSYGISQHLSPGIPQDLPHEMSEKLPQELSQKSQGSQEKSAGLSQKSPGAIQDLSQELTPKSSHELSPELFRGGSQGFAGVVPGILWMALILSLILSQGTLFHPDHDSGGLEMILLSPVTSTGLLTIKIWTHIAVIGTPLLVLTLITAWIFDLPISIIKNLAQIFCLGIPAICLVAAMATALTVQLKRGGVLLAILALPLMAPVLMFGSSATHAALQGLPLRPHLAVLLALLLLLLLLSPLTCLFALRIGAET